MVAPAFIPLLKLLLSGQGASAEAPAVHAPEPGGPEFKRQPIFIQPPVEPEPAALPSGSFTPQRQPSQGPLASIFGPEVSGFMRRFGGGMANIRGNPYGDPFITAAQGFSGATGYADEQDRLAQERAAAANETAYKRQRDLIGDQRTAQKDAADLALRQAAETRQAKTSEYTNRKTALEIRKLARQNGVTTSEMLQIERIAQAAAEGIVDPAEREQAIQAERERLTDMIKNGEGISGAGGGLGGDANEYTATNPETGDQLVYRGGQWVDAITGEPWGQ